MRAVPSHGHYFASQVNAKARPRCTNGVDQFICCSEQWLQLTQASSTTSCVVHPVQADPGAKVPKTNPVKALSQFVVDFALSVISYQGTLETVTKVS